jgi:type I restriction enzyme M protein
MTINFTEKANFIWSIAELLRGDYKQSDYGKVVLPFTVLRRLDCVLEPTKEKVLDKLAVVEKMNLENIDPILNQVSGYKFHNRSKYDFNKLIADPENIAANLRHYINGFSESARETFEHFDFEIQIERLDKADLLYLVVKRFQEIDLHPNVVSNNDMGYIFEELIRKFSEISNETAGEHFTPREVIRLMVNILFLHDRDILTKEGIVETMYDCCAGTGGMLSIAEEYLRELNPKARLEVFGQELNPESYSICKSDMMIKGQNSDNIKLGNSFSDDQLSGNKFSYMLTNPPFGVEWKKVQKSIQQEHDELGYGGRFGAGLPRISDGSLMFLQHLISKMRPANGGARIGIVFNGSPLFSGGAGSGESEIRRWIIENDMLEAIIALPDQLFYNTGIYTYLWFVSNRKSQRRKGKVQMINAVSFFVKMSKSLGNKRNYISEKHIQDITNLYGDFQEIDYCKIFDNEDFGYSRITVERPLKDEKGDIIKDKKGDPKPDPSLRDYENIPLKETIQEYFEREVIPHVPDAWIDESKTKIGYEVNFTRYFYKYKPLRSLEEIKADILALEEETKDMIHRIIED